MPVDKKIKIAINGFGRIGSVVLRAILNENYDVTIAAVNTKGNLPLDAYGIQLKYDSVYGRLPYPLKLLDPSAGGEIGQFQVANRLIPVLGEPNPKLIPWKKYDVDVVLECTGFFVDNQALAHLDAGARKVIISAPAKDPKIPTFILGVNESHYQGQNLISNGSCTTNCVAPIVKLIDEKIGFQQGILTAIHAYTANQNLVDGNASDPRRARAAAINIVPTSTGAAESVIAAYPEAKGRFAGSAIRVPVICGSYSDLTFKMVRQTTVEEINAIFEEASVSPQLVGKLKVSYEPLVSSDVIGNSASGVIDTRLTKVVGDDLVAVAAWYDNEYGYSCRLVEQAMYICK
jgi:glyceraldehyde 3-phosphate dehydrogenase